jgi:hypothetical protein
MKKITALTLLFTLCLFHSRVGYCQGAVSRAEAYCTPAASTCTSNYISRVQLGSIDNTTGCSVSAYGDYTVTVPAASLYAGNTVNLTVTLQASGTSSLGAWIDFNGNTVFETSEFFLISSATSGTVTTSIFFPVTATAGPSRIRIRRKTTGTITSGESCTTIAGETEDYAINILPATVKITHTAVATSDSLYSLTRTLTATIVQTDVGLNTTDSLKPRLWVKRAASSPWKQVKGTLTSGTATNGQWSFVVQHDSLGIRHNDCDSVQYYFVAQDFNTPSYIGYLPGAGAAHTNVQQQESAPSTFFGYRLRPRIKDTIYVSQSNCSYTSLTNSRGLFQKINTAGLEGNLTIMIESDLVEQGTNELDGSKFNGYALVIRPINNTLRTIRTAAPMSIPTIKLKGVKKFAVDGSYGGTGKYLAFEHQTYDIWDTAANFRIYNSCDTVLFTNCIFRSKLYGYLGNLNSASVWISGGVNRNIAFYNNLFENIPSATDWPMRHILSVGDNVALVRNNEFANSLTADVFVSGGNNWIIDSNYFYRNTTITSSGGHYTAINVNGGGHTIQYNNIGGRGRNIGDSMYFELPTSVTGIYLNTTAGAIPNLVRYNHIQKILVGPTYFTTVMPQYFAGIYNYGNNAIITNNIIGDASGNSFTLSIRASSIYGIFNMNGLNPGTVEDNLINGITRTPSFGFTAAGYMYGISQQASSTYDVSIRRNRIMNLKNPANVELQGDGGATNGIYLLGGRKNILESNIISDMYVDWYSMSGIYYESGSSTSDTTFFIRNRISRLVNASTFSNPDDTYNHVINGISIAGAVNTALEIANNQVSIDNNNISSSIVINGIMGNISVPSRSRIIYNSVYIGGTATNAAGSAPFTTRSSELGAMYNNIFYNNRTGGTKGNYVYRFLVYNPFGMLQSTGIDNNLYVQQDTNYFAQSGTFAPTPTKWTGWLNAVPSADRNSYMHLLPEVPANQLFVGKDSGNLDINTAYPTFAKVNGRGRPLAGLHADFGALNVRSTTTGTSDIGSDEFFGVFPVTLVHFIASRQDSRIKLEWRTVSEQNTATYRVEKLRGNNWVEIGSVAANNFSGTNDYLSYDRYPVAGNNRYRLRMVDRDGSYRLSAEAAVFIPATSATILSAWEERGEIMIRFSQPLEDATLSLYNAAGATILQQRIGNASEHRFATGALAKGAYTIVVPTAKGEILSRKVFFGR